MYYKWLIAATAGGFIAPRDIAPGFIAPSASLPLAGVKFVPHNTPSFFPRSKIVIPFHRIRQITDRQMKSKGYTSEAF